ncbi:hypothetical protein JL721_2902 [Aureococcus anophagefferens]|nr:hypothetical protein JL721_2902 [Aureococcus anophagefferens]
MRAARELRAHPGEPDVAEVLIQLDRIPDADTAELERLESGVARLLESQPGLASSALGKYAAKQQQCVRAELDERRARARVLELLTDPEAAERRRREAAAERVEAGGAAARRGVAAVLARAAAVADPGAGAAAAAAAPAVPAAARRRRRRPLAAVRGADGASPTPTALPEDAPSSAAGAWRQDGVEFVPAPAAPRSARASARGASRRRGASPRSIATGARRPWSPAAAAASSSATRSRKKAEESDDAALDRARRERRAAANERLKLMRLKREEALRRKRAQQALRRERDRAAAAKRDDASSASESVSGGDSDDDDDDDATAAAVVPLDELHASALAAARTTTRRSRFRRRNPSRNPPRRSPSRHPSRRSPPRRLRRRRPGTTFAMRLGRTASSADLAAEEAPRDDGRAPPEFSSVFSQWATLQCSPGKEPKQKPSVAEIKLQLARQWRLYTVYKAVMSDYAAVFSHHRALEGEGKSAAVYGGSAAALHFRVNSSRPEVFDIVTQVLTRRDGGLKGAWEELPNGLGLKTTWNLLWTWSRPRINYAHLGAGKESDMPNFKGGRCPLAHLLTWQKVNHYPHAKHLTRKDFLARSIGRCRHLAATGGGGKHAGFFDLCPETYLLPAEYSALVAAHVDKQKRGAKPTWIMKPVGLSRGRGISVVSSIEDVTYADPVVVQAYLDRPRLLGGHKFDLRLYVLEKGELYGPLAGAGPDEAGGTKCSLDFLWRRLRREDPTFDEARVWDGVRELVLKSLVCVEDSIPHQPNSFELFGYDVLIDADSRCWLIEVNASPSMARETSLDADVKERCIRDVINLVDPVPYDRDALVDVFDKRLKAAETGERLLAAPRRSASDAAPPTLTPRARPTSPAT